MKEVVYIKSYEKPIVRYGKVLVKSKDGDREYEPEEIHSLVVAYPTTSQVTTDITTVFALTKRNIPIYWLDEKNNYRFMVCTIGQQDIVNGKMVIKMILLFRVNH